MFSGCISNDPSLAELYIVQPGIAYEFARSVRDRLIQAVLPIDTSIIKARGARAEDVLENDGFWSLICAFGVGVALTQRAIGCIRLDHLRYGKIVVAVEESLEGRYVRTQVVSLLNRFVRPVVAAGHLYAITLSEFALDSESNFEKEVMAPATRVLLPITA